MGLREETYNMRKGNMTEINCPKCKNRGYFMYEQDGYSFIKECECMKVRRLVNVAERCGLKEAFKQYTFKAYKHEEQWQEDIYDKAILFLKSKSNGFYIGGQVGAGKSHICTAIVRQLVIDSCEVEYVVWNDIITKLKQCVLDSEEYAEQMRGLQQAEVLYIDDFFKTEPTKADLDKAFQIINYRYNATKSGSSKRYITIISSEKTINELRLIDDAIASRIYEMCSKDFVIGISKDVNKNMRFK